MSGWKFVVDEKPKLGDAVIVKSCCGIVQKVTYEICFDDGEYFWVDVGGECDPVSLNEFNRWHSLPE